MSGAAINILENWIASVSQGRISVPSVECFVTRSGKYWGQPNFLRKSCYISTECLLAQIQYDLTAYYFIRKQYNMSKKHLKSVISFMKNFPEASKELSFSKPVIEGYCTAMKVNRKQRARKSATFSGAVLKDGISDATMGILEEDVNARNISLTTRSVVERSVFLQRRNMMQGRFVASNVLCCVQELLAVTGRCVKFLMKKENIPTFCKSLLTMINRFDCTSQATILSMYLKVLCSIEPALEQHLNKTGVKMALGSFGDLLKTDKSDKQDVSSVSEIPHRSCSMRYSSNGDPLWRLTRSFDPMELKGLLPALHPFRLPARYKVPSTLIHLYGRLSLGYVQDIVGLFSSKMKQIAVVGNQEAAQCLVNGCMLELASVPNDPFIHGVISSEPLKLQLENWHELLHRNADVRQVGLITQKLVPKVKGYVGALASVSRSGATSGVSAGGTSIEMATLTAVFLLNSCDWEYLMGRVMTNPDDRIMNFAKMLAAMCHELSQGNIQPLKLVARTFFDIMLPTVENSGTQFKRKATGEKQPVSRQLVSRQQLAGVVYLVKEQTATSLLIGFFGKLFNSIQGGLEKIFVEHMDLWPVTFAEHSNLNEDFVREMLAACVRNGLLINPNNAFCLRTQADLFFVNQCYRSAMQYYIQTMVACSDGFSKPLPDNVVNDEMFRSMIKCCMKLKRYTQAALLSQCLSDIKEGLCLGSKALEESRILDAQAGYYQFIWESNFFELFISVLAKQRHISKLEKCTKHISCLEFNCHNRKEIHDDVMLHRRTMFLKSLCRCYF